MSLNEPSEVSDLCMLYVTCPTSEVAGTIAERLTGSRIAGCVNILPNVSSVYFWNGAIEHSNEVLMLVKTLSTRKHMAVQLIKELHPYEVPCILSFQMKVEEPSYGQWIAANTT